MTKKNTAFIEYKNIAMSYPKKTVAENITFDIQSGEVFGLIGLNGIGKTTLIKAITGLKLPDEGQIFINGMMPCSPKAKQSFAYLPERFDPPPFLSGINFIRFSLSLYGKKVDLDRTHELCHALGFDADYLKQSAKTYSKGMRQKLGLMATILTECPLLILDEPMSGLDPRARVQVKNLIEICKKNGQTVFLSSHILGDLETLCDRVTVLHDRKIQFIGKPANLNKEQKAKTLEKAFLSLIDL